MESLKRLHPRQGIHVADILYIATNAAFITVLVLLIFAAHLPILAFVLAVASKWRVVAVRPRYWGINLRSNLPDLLVITGLTALAVYPAAGTAAQLFWLALLIGWLVALKRLSSQIAVLVQAAAVQLIGLTALLAYTAFIPYNQLFFLAVACGGWGVAYAAARHMLTFYSDEPKTEFFALLWGFIAAEIVWVLSHWLQTYQLAPGLAVPQAALILLLLSFAAQRAYHLQRQIDRKKDPRMKKKGTRRALSNLYGAVGFSAVLILVILFTSNWHVSI